MGRQLRTSVLVQSLAMVLAGFVIGAPLGMVIGRTAWPAFASQLGVVPTAAVPIPWVAALGVVAILVAVVAAAGPGRVAARTKPAAPLRSE